MRKLTAKKLDQAISTIYYKAAEGLMINIMDIGKVFAAGRNAYAATADLAAVEVAIKEQVAKLCQAA
jgi:uncharacterized protein YqeY